jgi:hypothetical protein
MLARDITLSTQNAPGLACVARVSAAIPGTRRENTRTSLRSCGPYFAHPVITLCELRRLAKIRRVGKGALAPCPPSITGRAFKWWARFRLRSLRYGGQVALPPYDLVSLRTDLPLAQAQSQAAAYDISTCRANHLKPVQPLAQKYSAFHPTQISGSFPLSRLDKRGGSRVVTNAGRDAVDAAASGAKRVRRAGFPVSGHGAQDDRRCSVRQNRVVLAPVAGVKLPGAILI